MSGKNYGILLILIGLLIVNTGMAERTWSITQNGNVLEIAYGSGQSYYQYAALHLDSSYFRMNYGPGSGWGTSVILAPSFWELGEYHQGAPVNYSWASDGDNLLIHFNGQISNLGFKGDIRILPPVENQIIAEVNLLTSGHAILDSRPGEAFKPMMLSSMHISADEWDAQSAYAGYESFSIPYQGLIKNPPLEAAVFGLVGGSNVWKTNAPSIEVILEDSMPITGWVTLSHDPNNDNIGFWASSSSVLPYWNYTIVSKLSSIALRASNGQYICAEGGGGDGVVANRNSIGAWETFKLIDRGNGNCALQAANGQYVCSEGSGGGTVVANRNAIGAWETFKLIDLGNGNYALQAANGQYVCAEGSGGGTVVANRNAIGAWETFGIIDLSIPVVPAKGALQAANGQYLCAEGSGGGAVVANRNAIGAWETFRLIDLGNGNAALEVYNGQYVCAEGGGGHGVVANRNAIGAWETFRLIDLGNGNAALQAANGQYLCAEGSGGDAVVANRNSIGAWETFKLIPK